MCLDLFLRFVSILCRLCSHFFKSKHHTNTCTNTTNIINSNNSTINHLNSTITTKLTIIITTMVSKTMATLQTSMINLTTISTEAIKENLTWLCNSNLIYLFQVIRKFRLPQILNGASQCNKLKFKLFWTNTFRYIWTMKIRIINLTRSKMNSKWSNLTITTFLQILNLNTLSWNKSPS